MGGLARKIPITFVTFAVATAAIAGIPPLAGFFSKDEILWFAFASSRGGSPLLFARRGAHGAADRVLHVPPAVAHVLRRVADGRREAEHHVHESPASMTGVLIVLAVLSAIGGFLAMPHYLEPLLPLPAGAAGARASRDAARRRLGRARARGPGRLPRSCSAATATRAERLRAASPRCIGCSPASTSSTRPTTRCIARPLYWISDRVFLRLGDRALLDGSLHGLAALARRTAGALGRVQTGNLHLYALLVLAGIVASLAWSWRHG